MHPLPSARELPSLSAILFDPALPVLGNPGGDVTIAEFFDYACSYCKILHPHLEQLLQEDGGIRLAMEDWPINGDLVRYACRMVLAADDSVPMLPRKPPSWRWRAA